MAKEQLPSALPFIPASKSIRKLAEASQQCQGCELYLHATQTVFGEGPAKARIMMVGEQPGDREDLEGRPFVGPAGKLLDNALAAAGIDRRDVYLTNAVKHFFFEERGKRRIHKKPHASHIWACQPWLDAEVARVKPEIIVGLGATAAQALVGRAVSVMAERGRWVENRYGKRLMLTIHPSALLRLPDRSLFDEQFAKFVAELRSAVQ